ncbi:hypothetical protein CXG81DRAFT_14651, partial [Caulochytrium protostelioides]
MDNRAKLVAEIVESERAYITKLELLQSYQQCLLSGRMPKDVVQHIFANLDELVDFQRRFLVGMEATLSYPVSEQRLGGLFVQNEEAFGVYEPFCSNYEFACYTVLQERERITELLPPPDVLGGAASLVLPSLLIAPVQRLCKYPLLLRELTALSQPDTYPHLAELRRGYDAIVHVTQRVNEVKRMEENRLARQDLIDRIEDWCGLDANDFGELLLSDKFPMLSAGTESLYHLFLFDHILLCCAE